jgi:hypothetical protein
MIMLSQSLKTKIFGVEFANQPGVLSQDEILAALTKYVTNTPVSLMRSLHEEKWLGADQNEFIALMEKKPVSEHFHRLFLQNQRNPPSPDLNSFEPFIRALSDDLAGRLNPNPYRELAAQIKASTLMVDLKNKAAVQMLVKERYEGADTKKLHDEMMGRIFAAVVNEMGMDAPAAGSVERMNLEYRLEAAVDVCSMSRSEFFTPKLRMLLQVAYAEAMADQLTKDSAIIHGITPLTDDTDAELLAKVLNEVNLWHIYDAETQVWLIPGDDEFISMMSILPEAIAVVHEECHAHRVGYFLEALTQSLDAKGLNNPYLDLLPQTTNETPACTPS